MDRNIREPGVTNNGGDEFDKPIGMFATGDGTAFAGVLDACLATLPFLLM